MAFSAIDGSQLGVNLAFTRFLFLRPMRDDDATRQRLRAAADSFQRGFFNAFGVDGGARDAPPHETINFLATNGCNGHAPGDAAQAPYVVQVSSKYRPRLLEADKEIRRRLADVAKIEMLEGAVRLPQYTSASMYAWAYEEAQARSSGRRLSNAIILPVRKNAAWWAMPAMERHQFFYPHHDRASGKCVAGHAEMGREAAARIYRRVFYNPEGTSREGEWDFITYFECGDEDLELFDATLNALRDVGKNPEWRYVEEGPIWRGRRMLRW